MRTIERVERAQPAHERIAGIAVAIGLHLLAACLLLREVPQMPPAAPRIVQMSLVAEPRPEPRPAPQSAAPPPVAAEATTVPPAPSPRPQPPQRRPTPKAAAAKPTPSTPASTQPIRSAAAQTVVSASVPASLATTATTAAAAPEAETEPRFDAAYLNNPAPAYPPLSRRLGEQGRVLMRVFVDRNGAPIQVELRQSSGSRRLDAAAEAAVRRWRFVPARRGPEAVGAWVLVPISFSLRNS